MGFGPGKYLTAWSAEYPVWPPDGVLEAVESMDCSGGGSQTQTYAAQPDVGYHLGITYTNCKDLATGKSLNGTWDLWGKLIGTEQNGGYASGLVEVSGTSHEGWTMTYINFFPDFYTPTDPAGIFITSDRKWDEWVWSDWLPGGE